MPARANGTPNAGRILHAGATLDALVGKEAAAHGHVAGHRRAHGPVDLQRQTHPVLAQAAVAVGARVDRRQERGHRVRMGVVQFDPVEAGLRGP
jgi:hypothetical protein